MKQHFMHSFVRITSLALLLGVVFAQVPQVKAWIPGAAVGTVEGELPDGTRFPLPGVKVIRYDYWHWGEDDCGPGVENCFNFNAGVETTTKSNGDYVISNELNNPGPICYDRNPGGKAYRCPTGPAGGINASLSAPPGNIPACTPAEYGYNWCGMNCGYSASRWMPYFPEGYVLPEGLVLQGYAPEAGEWSPNEREEFFGNNTTKNHRDFVFRFDIPKPAICGSVTTSSGQPVPNVDVIVKNDANQQVTVRTNSSGRFSTQGIVQANQYYAVRIAGNGTNPQTAPAGLTPPAKTSEAGWNWNFTTNPNPGTQPWGDTPVGSNSYESQRAASGIDCASPNGSGRSCRCSFVYDTGPIVEPTADLEVACRDQDFDGPLSYLVQIRNIDLNDQPFDRAVVFMSLSNRNSNDLKIRQYMGTPTWESGDWFGYWINGISTAPVNGTLEFVWDNSVSMANGKTLDGLATYITNNLPETYTLKIEANLRTAYVQTDTIGSQRIPVRKNACAEEPDSNSDSCRVTYSPQNPEIGQPITLTCNSTLPEDANLPHTFTIRNTAGQVIETITSPTRSITYTPEDVGSIRVCCGLCDLSAPTALEPVEEPPIAPTQ